MDPARWRAIKDVAANAMEQRRGDRTAYLAKACADDVDLRAQVDRLLYEHDRLRDFFQIPTPHDGPTEHPPGATQGGTGRAAAAPSTMLRKQRVNGADTPSYKYLPPEFLEQSIRRLSYLAWFYAVGYALNYVIREILAHLMSDVPFLWSQHGVSGAIASTFILGSLAVYAAVRRGHVHPDRLARVAVVFQIAGAFGIGVGQFSGGAIRGGWDATLFGISWACVWIVVFPFMVPLPQRVATMAAVCAALMDGAGIAIWVAAGTLPPPPVNALVAALVPNLVCAAIASIVARIVYRWGAELGRAQRLGSYQLESLLGRGGMGEVWIARHHMLARPAALKLIRPQVLNAGGGVNAVQLFEREAQSTAALTSPHTIKLYDYGTTPDGIFYYAMELLDGFDLDTLVRRFGAVAPERAVHFLLQVCDSLAEAHERGLVHRDIKPANIYTGRQGLEWDFIKVLDFGLVVSQERARVERDVGAAEPQIIGTPAYMPPEAVRGGEPDPRSDLYALGCVGYWLVTGRTVFDGDGPMELAMAHLRQQPEPPSKCSEFDVPAALDEAILWCLQKERAERPPSAQELAARLRSLDLARPWNQERARKWWGRHHGIAV